MDWGDQHHVNGDAREQITSQYLAVAQFATLPQAGDEMPHPVISGIGRLKLWLAMLMGLRARTDLLPAQPVHRGYDQTEETAKHGKEV